MTLEGGTVALYPYHGHLPGLLEMTLKGASSLYNVGTVSKCSSLVGSRLASTPILRSLLTMFALCNRIIKITSESLCSLCPLVQVIQEYWKRQAQNNIQWEEL